MKSNRFEFCLCHRIAVCFWASFCISVEKLNVKKTEDRFDMDWKEQKDRYWKGRLGNHRKVWKATEGDFCRSRRAEFDYFFLLPSDSPASVYKFWIGQGKNNNFDEVHITLLLNSVGADTSWSYIACGRKRLYQAPTLPCVSHCTRPFSFLSQSGGQAVVVSFYIGTHMYCWGVVAINYVQLFFLKFITE